MYRYRIFGLVVESEICLDILRTEADPKHPADITFKRGDIGYDVLPMMEASPHFNYEAENGVLMVWPGVAGFCIHSISSVTVQPYPTAPDSYLAFPILGPVIAWVLHTREIMTLHASAVLWRGLTIGFLGDKMAGKSTTAAAFIENKAELITDDLLAFDMSDPKTPLIQPTFAQLKLTDQSANSVVLSGSEKLPLVFEGFEKRQVKLQSMQQTPVPCNALLVLKRGGTVPTIRWYNGSDRLQMLMRFSYNVRFANAPLHLQARARHFRRCAELSKVLRVGELSIPAQLDRLQETVEHVGQTLKALS